MMAMTLGSVSIIFIAASSTASAMLAAAMMACFSVIASAWIHRVAEWAPSDAGLRMTS